MNNLNKSNKFKIFAFFIIILTCVILFSSCQNKIKNVSTEIALGDETGILAENSAVDFYFYYPENFTIERNDAMITIFINDNSVADILTKPNLSATVFGIQTGTYETAEEYWNDFVFPSYKEVFHDIEIVSEEDLTVDEIPAKKYTYTVSMSGMNFKISEVIFFRKQQVYDLTYTVTENKYDTYAHILNTAVDTFKFK